MTQNKHEMKLREMSDYPSLYPSEQEACIAGADALAALAAPPIEAGDWVIWERSDGLTSITEIRKANIRAPRRTREPRA